MKIKTAVVFLAGVVVGVVYADAVNRYVLDPYE